MKDNKGFIQKTEMVIAYVISLEKEVKRYTYLNEIHGCLLDILEELESTHTDWERINYKLSIYFSKEGLYAGNKTSDGDVYVSPIDLKDGAIQYYLNKALDYVVDNAKKYITD